MPASPQHSTNSLTRAMAHNVADSTDASVRAFGLTTQSTGSVWWREPGGSGIYLGAVILDGELSDADLRAALAPVQHVWAGQEHVLYDCTGSYDLAPAGYEKLWSNPWYVRSAAPVAPPILPAGLVIVAATTPAALAEFEQASWMGFEDSDTPFIDRAPYSMHPSATLNDPNMTYLVARLDGMVVAGVVVHRTGDMAGILGLSTIPRFRRRGYAAALVHASVALHPDCNVNVFPDPPSVPIYTRLGFGVGGEIGVWKSKLGD